MRRGNSRSCWELFRAGWKLLWFNVPASHGCTQYMHIPETDRCNWIREQIETIEPVRVQAGSAAQAWA